MGGPESGGSQVVADAAGGRRGEVHSQHEE